MSHIEEDYKQDQFQKEDHEKDVQIQIKYKNCKKNTLQNQIVYKDKDSNKNIHANDDENEDDFLLPDLAEDSSKKVRIDKKKVSINVNIEKKTHFQDIMDQINCQKNNDKSFSLSKLQEQEIDFSQVSQRLQKFVNFINFHEIKYQDIWKESAFQKKRNLALSLNQFCTKVHQNLGYYLSNNQLGAIMKLLSVKDIVRPNDFIKVGLWENALQKKSNIFSVSNMSLLKNKNQSNISELNFYTKLKDSKTKKSKNISKKEQIKPILKQRPSSASSKENNQNFTINAMKIQQKQLQKSEFELNNIINHSYTNLKKNSVKLYSLAKSKQKIESLKNDIKQNVLEKKWDFVVMVGEMNQWIQKMNQKQTTQLAANSSNISKSALTQEQDQQYPIRYKIYNCPDDGTIKISQFDKSLNIQKQIPEVVFIKKYESLKKKMKAQKNNKNNLKGTVLMVLEEGDKLTKNTLATRLDQRDQELNYVLLQIMRMKSIFTHQLKILKENHINE